jgi:hypothetical protein
MTITKPDPKEVERRAQADYEKHSSRIVSWVDRCETIKEAYRKVARRKIAQESMA